MASKAIYKITILNWDKYNATKKKGHRATLISNNFCNDNKLGTLPLTVRWMFLGIVLTCGDHTRDTVEMNEKQLRDLLESSWSIDRALESLKEIQVLTFEKIDLFTNRIEKKGIEKKRREGNKTKKEKKIGALAPLSPPAPAPENPVSTYCDTWKSRYGSRPDLRKKDTGLLSGLAKEVGSARASELIRGFLQMPEPWFVQKRHDVVTLVNNLNAINQFLKSGTVITKAKMKILEDHVDEAQGTLPSLKISDILGDEDQLAIEGEVSQ